MEGWFVCPGNVFGMDTDTVVVASAICEGKHMDLRISELPGVYDSIGSGPGSPCQKPGDVLHVPNLCSFVDDGLKGPSPGFGDTSYLSVSVSVVVSGPGPPEPELGDTLGLPDFSSDIDPGPGEPFPGSGSILAWPIFLRALAPNPGRSLPESGGVPDRPGSADDFTSGPGKPFPGYGGALLVRDYLDAIEHKAEAFPR